jgi:hypothetical protein
VVARDSLHTECPPAPQGLHTCTTTAGRLMTPSSKHTHPSNTPLQAAG